MPHPHFLPPRSNTNRPREPAKPEIMTPERDDDCRERTKKLPAPPFWEASNSVKPLSILFASTVRLPAECGVDQAPGVNFRGLAVMLPVSGNKHPNTGIRDIVYGKSCTHICARKQDYALNIQVLLAQDECISQVQDGAGTALPILGELGAGKGIGIVGLRVTVLYPNHTCASTASSGQAQNGARAAQGHSNKS